MADFTPKKVPEKGMAKSGQKAANASSRDAEHQSPPRLYLEHHHLEKLGLKKMPAVGSKINISGIAHLGATSENQDDLSSPGNPMGSGDSTPRRSMTLHLHKMEIGKNGPDNDVEQEEESKAGAKAEMDKALSKGAGSESKKGGKKD